MIVKIVSSTFSLVKNCMKIRYLIFFNKVGQTNLIELALIFTRALSNAKICPESLFSDNCKFLVTSSLIYETNEFESANYIYKFGQEQETYNIVAADGHFGRLIFHYASFNEKKSYPKFVDRFPQTKFANPENFCYFVSRRGRYGFLSNWLVEKGNGHVGEDGHNFLTAEQELMYLKAKVQRR